MLQVEAESRARVSRPVQEPVKRCGPFSGLPCPFGSVCGVVYLGQALEEDRAAGLAS